MNNINKLNCITIVKRLLLVNVLLVGGVKFFICFSNSDWPLKGLLVPGNEVIFSLETTTDYLTEYKNSDK